MLLVILQARFRLLGVGGASGSGKSTLARSLLREFPSSKLLSVDDFMKVTQSARCILFLVDSLCLGYPLHASFLWCAHLRCCLLFILPDGALPDDYYSDVPNFEVPESVDFHRMVSEFSIWTVGAHRLTECCHQRGNC